MTEKQTLNQPPNPQKVEIALPSPQPHH